MIEFDVGNATIADLEAMLADLGNVEATGENADQLASLLQEIEALLGESDAPLTIGEEVFDSLEAKELLDQMAALGFSIMMQSMSQTMNEVHKTALEL